MCLPLYGLIVCIEWSEPKPGWHIYYIFFRSRIVAVTQKQWWNHQREKNCYCYKWIHILSVTSLESMRIVVHHLPDSNSFSISSIVGKLLRKSLGKACPNSLYGFVRIACRKDRKNIRECHKFYLDSIGGLYCPREWCREVWEAALFLGITGKMRLWRWFLFILVYLCARDVIHSVQLLRVPIGCFLVVRSCCIV